MSQREYLQTMIIENMRQKARVEKLIDAYQGDYVKTIADKFEAERILNRFEELIDLKTVQDVDITEMELDQKLVYEQMVSSLTKLLYVYEEVLEKSGQQNLNLHNISNYHMWMLADLELGTGLFTKPILMPKTEDEMTSITNGYELTQHANWVQPFCIPIASFSHEMQIEYKTR